MDRWSSPITAEAPIGCRPASIRKTGLFYVNAAQGYSLFYLTLDERNRPEGHQAGNAASFWSESALLAIDYQTGKIRWRHEEGPGVCYSGILTTAGRLLFTSDVTKNLMALQPETGQVLWHAYAGGLMNSSPMTYQWGAGNLCGPRSTAFSTPGLCPISVDSHAKPLTAVVRENPADILC